ncbi:hypothetical protein HPP92_011559 [Vanilla planifolia]|uniref:Uncharacterized protein n=1 Tax=Vanilla planifolia TaxID=51239 RepID=A0A835V4I9_VANPL|nr:hypothetical protein HPP92_011559 [Vanilla planifolia]
MGEETDKLAHVVSYGSEKGALKRDEETPPSPSALDCHMTVQANPLQDSTSPSSDLDSRQGSSALAARYLLCLLANSHRHAYALMNAGSSPWRSLPRQGVEQCNRRLKHRPMHAACAVEKRGLSTGRRDGYREALRSRLDRHARART